jgi:hypothetical protein
VAVMEMLSADLAGCAARLSQSLTKESPDVPVLSSAFKAFARKAELLLKFARQIDRFAHIQRQHLAEEEEG